MEGGANKRRENSIILFGCFNTVNKCDTDYFDSKLHAFSQQCAIKAWLNYKNSALSLFISMYSELKHHR